MLKIKNIYPGQIAELKNISIESTGQLIFWIQLPGSDNILSKTLEEIDSNYDNLLNNYSDGISNKTINFRSSCLKTAKKCANPKIYLVRSKVDDKFSRAVCVEAMNLGGGSIYGSTCAPVCEASKLQVGCFFLIDQGRYECHSNKDQTVFVLEDVLAIGSENATGVSQVPVCSVPKNQINCFLNLPPAVIACKINGLEIENHLLNEKLISDLKQNLFPENMMEISSIQSIESIILPGTFAYKLTGMIIENIEILKYSADNNLINEKVLLNASHEINNEQETEEGFVLNYRKKEFEFINSNDNKEVINFNIQVNDEGSNLSRGHLIGDLIASIDRECLRSRNSSFGGTGDGLDFTYRLRPGQCLMIANEDYRDPSIESISYLGGVY